MNNLNSGFILINKPIGPTSHDIVSQLRKITGIKKIGHAGTLDPFASGLLIVAIGREATRGIDKFVKLDKEYLAVLKLGAVSDTYDPEGKIEIKNNIAAPAESKIVAVLEKFLGEQEQVPPMFSAKKINGQKLYNLARQGKIVQRQPNKIKIYNLEIVNYCWPKLTLKIRCSSGTYIRSLGNDIGESLGCGAYVAELTRTIVGSYLLDDCVDIETVDKKNWTKYLFS
jgi:tRNA pseudouridine55 synthase